MKKIVTKAAASALIMLSLLAVSTQAQAGFISFIEGVPHMLVLMVKDFPKFITSGLKTAMAAPQALESILEGMLNAATSASQQKMARNYSDFHQSQTNTDSAASNQFYAGNSDPYSSKLKLYKGGSQTCTKGQCIPSTSATTTYNTSQYNPAQKAAASAYVNNSAGAGPAKPSFKTADPSAVSYTASYNHQVSNQSTSTLVNTRGTAGRTTSGSGGIGKSAITFLEDAFRFFAAAEEFAEGMVASFFVKPVLGAVQGMLSMPHTIGRISTMTDGMSKTTSSLNNQAANATQVTTTNPKYQQAQTAQSGGPTQKGAYE